MRKVFSIITAAIVLAGVVGCFSGCGQSVQGTDAVSYTHLEEIVQKYRLIFFYKIGYDRLKHMNDCSYIERDFQKRKEKTMRNISEKQSIEEVEVCEGNHQHQLEYLKNRMPTQQEMETAAELFKMFGDPTRLKLLAALLGQEVCRCV